MLDYHLARTRYQEHEREVNQHLLEQQVIKASRESHSPGAISRAWSWLICKAAALMPGKQRLSAAERGGC
jgi:hypothetical protein